MSRPFITHSITDDSALGGSLIERSLRFEHGANSVLSRSFSSTGNQRTFTMSAWIKKCHPTNRMSIFSQAAAVGSNEDGFEFDGIELRFYSYVGGSFRYQLLSSADFRDPNAWYHIVASLDTPQATASNRAKIYINGTQITDLRVATYPSQNNTSGFFNNSSNGHRIGGLTGNAHRFDGYLADVYFLDGYAYDPSYFGYTESQTGIWRPKRYTGAYGSNGYHLELKDNSSTSTLGTDTSGNGNNFSASNFSVAAGVGNDSVEDTPTNKWCTLNPLAMIVTGNVTPSNGNLDASFGTVSGGGGIASTFAVSSGKWYWEITITAASGNARIDIGVLDDTFEPYSGSARYAPGLDSKSYAYVNSGTKYNNNTDTSYGASYGTNDVIGVALDLDNGTITFYKNNVSQGQAFSGLTGGFCPGLGDGSSAGTHSLSANFGQQGFTYTPPTDFKALNSANLPLNVPSIIRPQKHFDTLTYTGNAGTDHDITGLQFKPDLVWIKSRSQSSSNHGIVDSVRLDSGSHPMLYPNLNNAETVGGSYMDVGGGSTPFLNNGIRVNNNTSGNNNGSTYVAWCWKAGGAAVTNTTGNISAQVSVNDEAGFSIITYTGDGNSSGNVGTGLRSTQPLDMAIVKRRDSTSDWHVGHRASGQGSNFAYHLNLNDNGALSGSAPYHMGSQSATNGDRLYLASGGLTSSATYVAYVWQERPGYSKFGKYTGNGSADGAFVFTGFRPAWVMTKRTDSSDHWNISDAKRGDFNEIDEALYANNSQAEGWNGSLDKIDYLSNGFKIRANNSQTNASGGTYIYMAFAEQPGLTPYDTQTNAR
tara:strand:+ start:26 stop:2479 length:2454 start_codon:yes stop_codon:yes gene_type:complete